MQNTQPEAELNVSAKILTNPTFTIPDTEPEEILVDSTNTMRSALYGALEAVVQSSGGMSSAIRFTMGTYIQIPFTLIDIAISSENEGFLQASITAITATGATVALGIAITSMLPATMPLLLSTTIVGIGCDAFNYLIGKLLDGVCDFAEESIEIKKFNEANKELTFETTIDNYEDLKKVIFPTSEYILNNLGDVIDTIQVEQNTDNENIIYTIQKGDTIWNICNTLDITYDELISLNPWLSDRFSDDMTYALIRPDEKLVLPTYIDLENNKVKEMLDWYHQAQTVVQNYDPLLIDLNNDGIITTTTVDDGVYFDNKNDGFMERTAWVSGDDGVINSFDERFNEILCFGEVA